MTDWDTEKRNLLAENLELKRQIESSNDDWKIIGEEIRKLPDEVVRSYKPLLKILMVSNNNLPRD